MCYAAKLLLKVKSISCICLMELGEVQEKILLFRLDMKYHS